MIKRAMLTLSRRLRATRVSTGVQDPQHFAILVGIEPDRYQKIERSEAEPTVEELAAISLVTGKSLDFLVTGASAAR